MEPVRFDARLQSPCTGLVIGPTGCGKTYWILRMIASALWICTHPPVQIVVCYGEWQPAFEDVQGVRFHQGMLDVDDVAPSDGQHRWLIIDDLLSETAGTTDLNNFYTKYSHHRNLSVFYLTQKPPFGKELRTVSLNAHYYFWFKNPRDKLSIINFAKQAFPGASRGVVQAYEHATRRPWSFLLINLRQDTPESCRLIGNYADPDRAMVAYEIL